MEITRQIPITLDFRRPTKIPVPTVKQFDSNRLVFTVLDEGETADLSSIDRIIFNLERPDGHIYSYDIEAVKNVVEYDLSKRDMEVAGICKINIQLYEGNRRLSSIQMRLDVAKNLGAYYETSEGMTLLQEIFVEVSDLAVEAQSAAAYAKNQGDYAKEQAEKAADLEGVKDEVVAAATEAETQATFAKTQGDYAKEQADLSAEQYERLKDTYVGSLSAQLAETEQQLGSRIDNIVGSAGDGKKDTEIIDSRYSAIFQKTFESLSARIETGEKSNSQKGLNVRDFGAKGDGITDDTNAFRSAENALPNSGGKLFVPEGTYIVSHRVKKPNVTIEGVGYSSILKTPPNSTKLINDCPLRVFADYCVIRNLKIDGNKENNSHLNTMELAREADGIGIYSNYNVVENVWVHGAMGHHIIVWNDHFADENHPVGARHHNSVRYCLVTAPGLRNTVDFASTKELGPNYDENINYENEMIGNKVFGNIVVHTGWDTLVQGNLVVGSGIGHHSNSRRVIIKDNIVINGNIHMQGGLEEAGLEVRRLSRDIICEGNFIKNSGTTSIAARAIDGLVVKDNQIFSPTNNGIMFEMTSNIHISSNLIKEPKGRGVYQVDSLTAKNLIIENNRIESAQSIGIEVKNIENLIVNGNILTNGSSRGISVGVDCKHVEINNNVLNVCTGDGIVTSNNYCKISNNSMIEISGIAIASVGTNCAIFGNTIRGAGRGVKVDPTSTSTFINGNSFSGAIGTVIDLRASDTVIRNNYGYTTESNGVASIITGTKKVTINHKLSKTPGFKDISITPTNSLGNASKYWISNITSTSFDLNVNADPGGTNADFAWSVIII